MTVIGATREYKYTVNVPSVVTIVAVYVAFECNVICGGELKDIWRVGVAVGGALPADVEPQPAIASTRTTKIE
ncbi:MAG: hypothetical protein NVSMB52_03050 [Chloroflexota bacterium]